MRTKYKAVIIGAGRIGGGLDKPSANKILTHAHACFKNPNIQLVAFIDNNIKAGRAMAKRWGCEFFSSLQELYSKIQPDIICICTPNDTHFTILQELSHYQPKLVICEKPLTTNLKDTESIKSLYKQLNIPILVNYTRRFDKDIQKLRNQIISNHYGKILLSSGIYNKGILHNGSHMIDLCRYLFGEFKSFSPLYAVDDYNQQDKTVGGFLHFSSCSQFYLKAGDFRNYSIFELDILFEKMRVRLTDFAYKISYQAVGQNKTYKGIISLGNEYNKKNNARDPMYCMVENAVNFLEGREALKCTILDALEAQKVCDYIGQTALQI